MVTKGETTRATIIDRALSLASTMGLDGLTIGQLAKDLDLSKSGLFAHFRSKEALQIQVLQEAANRFAEVVIKPALKAERGLPRIRALFDNWLAWPKRLEGGCPFYSAAFELDDRTGAVRDRLVSLQKEWAQTRMRIAQRAVQEGHFSSSSDVEQFSHELHGLMMNHHYASRLLRDRQAEKHTRVAFEALIARFIIKKKKN